jgi:hypothetical protein
MTSMIESRRSLLCAGTIMGGALLMPLGACTQEGKEKEVGAVEDLMREHGVLRRVLLVYQETATRIRANTALDPAALNRAAKSSRRSAKTTMNASSKRPIYSHASRRPVGRPVTMSARCLRSINAAEKSRNILSSKPVAARLAAMPSPSPGRSKHSC